MTFYLTLAVYLTLVGGATLMIFRRPGVALGQLLVTYGLSQWCWAMNGWFLLHGALLNEITGALIVLGVVVAFIKRKPVFHLPREYWIMLALYLFAVTSVIWSVNSSRGWELLIGSIPNLFVFGFLPPLIMNDREDLKGMIYTVLLSGSVICTLLLFTTTWDDRSIRLDTSIIFSNFDVGNPLAVATIGSHVALVALLLNFRGAARAGKILQFALFGIGLALAVKSGSRGQALTVVAVAMLAYPFSRRLKDVKSFIGFAASAIVLGLITFWIFDLLTAQALDQKRWSMDTLMEAYGGGRIGPCLEMLGHWAAAGPFAWVAGLGVAASYKWLGIYPHVVAVEVLVEYGLIGFAILITFFCINVRSVRALWAHVRNDEQDRGIAVALLAIYLFEIVMSFKQGAFLGACSVFALGTYVTRLVVDRQKEAAFYAQLDAGGYAITDEERAHEFESYGEDLEAYPDLATARV